MKLRNRNVLLTGASRGLGRALAFALGRRGARLALVARNAGPLHETLDALRAEGIEAHGIQADVGNPGAGETLAAFAAEHLGRVDIVIHNASTLGATPLPLLADTEDAVLERVFQVNVLGPAALTRALAGSMLLRGEGLVVAISSDAAENAYPTWGAYAASKRAFDHLMATWAAESADAGVRFLSIDPGEMDTAMHAAALPDADPATLARPEDVAARIAALVDDPTRIRSGSRMEVRP